MSVACYVDLEPSESYSPNELRYVYPVTEINLKQAHLSATKKIFFYFVLPGIVGMIVLGLALRFCVRRIYTPETALVEEEDPQAGAHPVSSAETGKVIAGTGMMSIPNIDHLPRDTSGSMVNVNPTA